MPVTFEPCPMDVKAIADRIIAAHHQRLQKHEVRINYLFAFAEKDDNNEPKGPAIKSPGGYPAAAQVRLNSLRDRVEGKADATIVIDGDEWKTWSDRRRAAVLDHELEHLEPTGETDDVDRPKLKLRKHDVQIGGFLGVIERHQDNAIEFEMLSDAGKAVRERIQREIWG